MDLNDAKIRRVESAVRVYVTGKQSINWAMSQIDDTAFDTSQLREIIERTVNNLAEVFKDKPIKELGNELLARLSP